MVRWRRRLLYALAALIVSAPVTHAQSLTFGVVPQQSASRLLEMWSALLEHLSERSGLELKFATATDIPTFESCLAEGAYDIAYMNPYHYVVFHQAGGYAAFARQADSKLKGVLVVRTDSAIAGIEDMARAEIAFPSPAAFGASVLPRAELAERGIAFKARYVKSHDSVYRAVAMGLVPVGGGVVRTFRNVAPEIRDQLKIVYETDAYTPHAFAARLTLSENQIDALADAMVAAARQAPDLLRQAGFVALQKASDADWNDIRRLSLDQRQTRIQTKKSESCHSG
ncbi:MAG: phosphate/phosphite/phosphonate ABC transporter substrate-binding protein [Alphaproteobacteria bacterium]